MAAAAAKSLQSCPTLCDPIDSSPPGSPVPGILQARTLEWVATSFSNAWKWKVKVKSLSCVRPSVTPWTAAFQAPPSVEFSRQEYWSGVPLPSSNRWWRGAEILKEDPPLGKLCIMPCYIVHTPAYVKIRKQLLSWRTKFISYTSFSEVSMALKECSCRVAAMFRW